MTIYRNELIVNEILIYVHYHKVELGDMSSNQYHTLILTGAVLNISYCSHYCMFSVLKLKKGYRLMLLTIVPQI